MKKKLTLSAAFTVSLLPMLLNQYGGMKGVQEISGIINLLNPIGVVSVLLFSAGVWMPLKKPRVSRLLGGAGCVGIVFAEIYRFFTWHVQTVTGKISFANSLRLTFPAFYFGLSVSLAMVAVYCMLTRKEQ